MIDQFFEYADENNVPSESFGNNEFGIVLDTTGNISDINVNKTYFIIIVKDNDTSTEVWRDHWWEGGSTPDNSDVDYFNDTLNKNHLYVVSMTLSDSSEQKVSQTITQSLGTYFANDSFEWSNIEHILFNNGYDTIEFILDRSEEQQIIRKLTISYDTQKITKLEYSFSDDPNFFVEYDVIDEQNINSGVIIGSGLQYLYVRPTEAVSENTIDQACFNSLNNLSLVGYDNATESWKFSLTSGYTSVGLTITTTSRIVTHTLTVVTDPANIQSQANIKINGVYASSGNYPKDEQIIIECKDSFEYEDFVYTLSSNNELRFLMPDDNTTVKVSYDRTPKKLKVSITTDPENMKETINGFSVVGNGEYNQGTLVNLSWNYNGSTDAFTYNKNKYEFVTWKIGNSSDENPSTSITVTEDIDIKLIFKKTVIAQDQTYYLGDSYQKHYRFKIQYKNAQTDPIILDWYPIVYDYGVNK